MERKYGSTSDGHRSFRLFKLVLDGMYKRAAPSLITLLSVCSDKDKGEKEDTTLLG